MLFKALANAGSAIDEMLYLPQVNGVVPLMVVDRTIFRKWRNSLRVLSITPMPVSQTFFSIPSGFNELNS